MTEFEINKAVSDKLGYIYTKSFDPCNNVEQAWEIMLKYNICVTKGDEGYYDAVHNLEFYIQGEWHVDICVSHKKPLVSAMLCFLELNK